MPKTPKAPKAKVTSFQGSRKPAVFKTVGKPVIAPGLAAWSKNVKASTAPPASTGWAESHFATTAPGAEAASAALPEAAKPKPSGEGAWSPGVAGIYEQTRANIAANLKSRLGSIENQENAAANEFGFAVKYKPEVGPNGERQVESLTVDPSNPFSRAAALQRSYDQAKRGATNSYAARGQLYAGSLQNAQNENAFGFQQGDNSLRSAFTQFILGQGSARQQAAAGAEAERIAAFAAALQQQLASTPEDPGAAPATTAPASTAPTAASPAAAAPDPRTATATAVAQAQAAAQAQAQAQAQAAANAAATLKPKKGYTHVQTKGPRAGLSYKVVNGYRVYEDGYRQKGS
jgi:hypothetical protein